ncbi:MAG: carboxypeptidase-like regulatory domain-containing protein, partial [Bacteroidota bacterium]
MFATEFRTSVRPYTLAFLLLCALNLPVLAQQFTGMVYDEVSGDPLPFVNIHMKGRTQGRFTDDCGKFTMHAESDTATLLFRYLGYAPKETLLKLSDAVTKIGLVPEDVTLDAVAITPEYSYDRRLFK